MNKTTSSLLLSSALLATTAVAGVPLNGLQGDGGIAFNPVAFLAGTYADGTNQVVHAPRLGRHRLGGALRVVLCGKAP